MKKDNPFTLTFGIEPSEYIARYENTETIISTFTANHPVSQTYMIEGVRGTGKTVMMTRITKEIKEDPNWIVVDLNSTKDLIEEFAIRLADACKKKKGILPAGFNISIAGFGVRVSGTPAASNYISQIEDMLASIQKKNKRVLITIDEVQHDENMRGFASEFQILIRKEYPLFLLMTGLYEQINAIQNDSALTFLLRTPKICLEPLSVFQIAKLYESVFDIDIEAAKNMANITKGYAFAFQALGMLYFEHRNTERMEKILTMLDGMLDDYVYKKIWQSLSGVEKRIMKSIGDSEMKVADVLAATQIESSSFSRYRDSLIKKGLIMSTKHGYVSIALPRFSGIISFYE